MQEKCYINLYRTMETGAMATTYAIRSNDRAILPALPGAEHVNSRDLRAAGGRPFGQLLRIEFKTFSPCFLSFFLANRLIFVTLM